jgi:2-polyprenyl-6-methoxyphenol hydroxylase-like FAD-dependent oxidoreductase
VAKILVAGGSLGGLFVANLLHRSGHLVTVLEKSVGSMDGRGAGIVTHESLRVALRECGAIVDETLGVAVSKRVTLGIDGSCLGEITIPQILTSWSRLYQILKLCFPKPLYLQGKVIHKLQQNTDEVLVECEDGSQYKGDLLIASDGIRSLVRNLLAQHIQPKYAGYIAWRGVCDEKLLSQYTRETLFNYFGFCLPAGEQMLGYPVAGTGNNTQIGHRRFNFVWYRPTKNQDELTKLLTDDVGNVHLNGIPPALVSKKYIDSMRAESKMILAPQFAEVIEKTVQPFFQPIYDVYSEQIHFQRVALMGDASFVARPHVGMGVTKAAEDAQSINRHIQILGANPNALRAYELERLSMGQKIIRHAQFLGRYMESQGSAGSGDQPEPLRNPNTVMVETALGLDKAHEESINI